MTEIDVRCCGDHPRDWNRPAVPGTGWCAECLTRLREGSEGDSDDAEVSNG